MRGVAAKPRAPVFVAQHQHRRGARIVVAVDEGAAELRAHAEHVEEIGRDHAGVDAVGLAAIQQVERHLVELHQPAEAGELLAVVVELGNGDADGVLTGQRRRFLEQHQSIAFHVRQRLEQHAVDDAEHRGVGPDAQAEHQDGDQREPRLAPERSRRIAHRACGPVEPQQPALVAALLAHALDAAEPRSGAAARLVGRHALVHQVLGLEVEMKLQLGVELLVELLALTPRAHLPSNPLQHGQTPSVRMRWTAAAIRSHCAVSSRSWRWPVFVSR